MIRYVYLNRASGFGSVYDFELAGDALPNHSHGPDEQHSLAVLQGRVELVIDGDSHGHYDAGESVNFDSSQPHQIVALMPDTMTFHRYANGKPSWYTPEMLMGGTIDG